MALGVISIFFGEGVYNCRGCGVALYNSNDKMRTNSGWPDFEAGTDKVQRVSLGGGVYEILCKNCNGHLGHIFEDSHSKTNERH